VEEAIGRLAKFIRNAFRNRLRRVGLVIGKGIHSPEHKSVLRPEVENWLFAEGAKYVLAVADAPRTQGGRGMLVVTLRIKAKSTD
jgi:DNA-nicking Smr family endonuclease